MSTSDENLSFSNLGPLLRINARPRLQLLAAAIAARRGVPKPSSGQPMSVLITAARKLALSKGDLAGLTSRESKAAIELFWLRMEGWTPSIQDIRAWLDWASREWNTRTGITRATMSYIRNFDPDSDGTKELAFWLKDRINVVGGVLGEFAHIYQLLDYKLLVERIASALAEGRLGFFDTLDRDVRSRMVVQGSGLLVAVVDAYGSRCSAGTTVDTENVCRRLLNLLGSGGLSGARGSDHMKNHARISMISGIVWWAKKGGEKQADIDLALEIALTLASDPRMSKTRWDGVDELIVEIVQSWLTARTVENMFRVIKELKTDRQDMVEQRLAFWRSYLPHIRKAYLLCGRLAEPIAEKLNERYGSLRKRDSDHCGLLLQIVGHQGDRITVVDFNKNAKALFWTSSASPPAFFDKVYDGAEMRARASKAEPHLPVETWPLKFANFIEAETGIRQTFRGRFK